MADQRNCVDLAAGMTVAWLSNPNTRVGLDEVPRFLAAVHAAVAGLTAPPEPVDEAKEPTVEPAVSVRKSLASPDHIISLIDGKPYRTLARHLKSHGLTPDSYRARYGLRADYPMVAPAYSEARRAFAHAHGLGKVTGRDAPPAAPKGAAAAKSAAKAHLGTEG